MVNQWIGLRENLNGKPWFLPSNKGVSCKFSHHPILWVNYSSIFWVLLPSELLIQTISWPEPYAAETPLQNTLNKWCFPACLLTRGVGIIIPGRHCGIGTNIINWCVKPWAVEELLIWCPSTKAGVESLEGNPNGRQVGDTICNMKDC